MAKLRPDNLVIPPTVALRFTDEEVPHVHQPTFSAAAECFIPGSACHRPLSSGSPGGVLVAPWQPNSANTTSASSKPQRAVVAASSAVRPGSGTVRTSIGGA